MGNWEGKRWGRVIHLLGVSWLETVEGHECSRHYHQHKVNLFGVISGSIVLTEWVTAVQVPRQTVLGPGDVYSVNAGVVHKFGVLESGVIVERYISDDGQPVRDDDIVRLDEGGSMRAEERERFRK